MKSSATLSLLLLLPSIHAVALPQLSDSELESTSRDFKRDSSGELVPRFPKPGQIIPEATTPLTDDSSLGHLSNVKRDLSARSPQGPNSNPGEFTGFDLSRANPANRPASFGTSSSSSAISSPSSGTSSSYSGTSSSSSMGNGDQEETMTNGGSYDQPASWEVVISEPANMPHHRNHNSSRHHKWNSTHHAHRKEGILTEFNAHDEHIVVYNGTHFPNGTSYSPANTTANGGTLMGKVVVAGDEIAVYRQPWNATHHHHHHHPNQTIGSINGTATTGIWLPSGTAWIPSSTGTGAPSRHPHRKVPSAELAGFRGPKSPKKKGTFVVIDEYFSKLVKSRK